MAMPSGFGAVYGFACCVLEDCEAAVYAAAVNKVSADAGAAAFWCNQDDVDVFWWDNACLFFVRLC